MKLDSSICILQQRSQTAVKNEYPIINSILCLPDINSMHIL